MKQVYKISFYSPLKTILLILAQDSETRSREQRYFNYSKRGGIMRFKAKIACVTDEILRVTAIIARVAAKSGI